MTPEAVSVWREHVERLCKQYRAVNVGKAAGVGQSRLSEFRSGKWDGSQAFFDRLGAVYPLPEAKAPVARGVRGTTKTQEGHDETVWLQNAKAEVLALEHAAEVAQSNLDEIDELISSTEYQAMRTVVLDATRLTEVQSVLQAVPESGPSLDFTSSIQRLRSIESESRTRQAAINAQDDSGSFYTHAAFQRSIRVKVEKLNSTRTTEELLQSRAWRMSIRSLCAIYQPEPDERLTVMHALAKTEDNSFCESLLKELSKVRSITFPCVQFQGDPVGFVQTILGEDPWTVEGEEDQITLLLAVRDHKRVVAPSARGVGKTKAVAWLSWWRYCCWYDGRVCLSNFTGNQLRSQDWAELDRCRQGSGICLACRKAGVVERPCQHSQVIDCNWSETPTKGVWSDDKQRFIIGITGKETEALGGYHGEHLLVICDEFSGLTYELFNAWRGNITGPECRFLGPGNPLDGPGSPMYDAVNDERIKAIWNWVVVCLSAEVACKTGLPYLPAANEIEALAQEDERGKENPIYMINAQGRYPTIDEQCIYQAAQIIKAQDWENYAATPAKGALVIAIDPSGESGMGDDAVIGAIRGLKVLEKMVGRGWSLEDYLDKVIDLIVKYRENQNEVAIVGIDADGVGSKVLTRLDNYLVTKRLRPHEKVNFELVPVYFGQDAPDCLKYDQVRDEAAAHLNRWLKRGGVFQADLKLQQEMQIAKWYPVRRKRHGREIEVLSATRKDGPNGFRTIIHRSPDRWDMLRVFAYAAFMRDALVVTDERTEAAKIDEEFYELADDAIDERQAFRNYMSRIRKGRHA